MRILTRGAIWRLGALAVVLAAGVALFWTRCVAMAGSSYRGPLLPLTAEEKKLEAELKADVHLFAETIGERNIGRRYGELRKAGEAIEASLRAAGLAPRRHGFRADGCEVWNFDVENRGQTKPDEIVIVGAHYDSAQTTPGADDNATGVAATLALARRLGKAKLARTVRFAFFVNEEPPYFRTGNMGSVRYAKLAAYAKERVVAMLSLESIGYFDPKKGSQRYPPPLSLLYPSTGDFVAFVGNVSSRTLLNRCLRAFRRKTRFPSEGAALPGEIRGVGWSDHWAFWQAGYPAIMVTDTAPFRNPHYHTPGDRLRTLDLARTARIVQGLRHVVLDLAAEGAAGR